MPAVSYGYIPAQDAALVAWADNFRDLTTASPATYGLTPTDASSIAVLVDAYDASYVLATTPATRTSVTVAQKNSDRFAMLQTIRTYAAQIRLNPGVNDADKLALGLTLPNNSPSPIPAPVTFPLLTIQSNGPGQQTLNFADSASPALKAKPAGAIALQLFRGVAAAPIVDPALCAWLANVTRNPYLSEFEPADAGKVATYFARWITRRGLVGPWSAGASFGVAF